jgi:HD domain-containing protein
MQTDHARRPLWLLREPQIELPGIERGRPRLAAILSLAVFAALVPTFVFAAPESRWEPQSLFAILLAYSFVSYSARILLRSPGRGPVTYDAGFVAALLAVVFLGPLPAAVIFAAPELERWLTFARTSRVAASAASCGWAVLAAAFFLQATGHHPGSELSGVGDYAAVTTAGLILIAVNYFVGLVLNDMVLEGTPPLVLIGYELRPTSLLDLALIVAGVGTAVMYEELGTAGLAPLAAVILAPRWIATRSVDRTPMSSLPRWQATSLYARALAEEMRLDKSDKRVLADAATHLGGPATLTRVDEFHAVMSCVLHRHARWDGGGEWSADDAGDAIPLTSRILTVADSWSELTAEGTPELNPAAALDALKAGAGAELDPMVVAAAVRVVEAGTL